MRHKQTLWDRIIGRMVIEEHNAKRSFSGVRNDYIVIQDWRYPTKFRYLLRRLKIDRSDWERKLVGEKVIKST